MCLFLQGPPGLPGPPGPAGEKVQNYLFNLCPYNLSLMCLPTKKQFITHINYFVLKPVIFIKSNPFSVCRLPGWARFTGAGGTRWREGTAAEFHAAGREISCHCVCVSLDWLLVLCLQGPKGDVGETGPPGVRAEKGEMGLSGPAVSSKHVSPIHKPWKVDKPLGTHLAYFGSGYGRTQRGERRLQNWRQPGWWNTRAVRRIGSEQTLTVPVIRCVLAHLWLFWLRRCSGSDDFAARPTGPTRGSRVPWIYGEYLSSLFMQVETVQVRFVVRICSRHTHSLTRVFQGLHGVPGPKVRLHDYSMW